MNALVKIVRKKTGEKENCNAGEYKPETEKERKNALGEAERASERNVCAVAKDRCGKGDGGRDRRDTQGYDDGCTRV